MRAIYESVGPYSGVVSRSKSALSSGLPDWTNALGGRLRDIRAERGESLATVGAATGISPSFLSLLEQGKTDVSLGRLLPLLDHYGLGLDEVLGKSASPRDAVVRAADRQVLFSVAEGIDVYLASPDQRHRFIPFVVEYDRGARMSRWSDHPGEEFVFVLEGALQIEFRDADSVLLAVGDSIFFSSRRPHRISPDDARARALIVSSERDPRDAT